MGELKKGQMAPDNIFRHSYTCLNLNSSVAKWWQAHTGKSNATVQGSSAS